MSGPRYRTARKLTAFLWKLAVVVGACLAAAIFLGLRFYSAEHAIHLD